MKHKSEIQYLLFYLNKDGSIDDEFDPQVCNSELDIDCKIDYYAPKGDKDPMFFAKRFRYLKFNMSSLKQWNKSNLKNNKKGKVS